MAATRVLVIGMADSIHVSRWLDVAIGSDNDEVLLIPTSPHRRIQAGIRARLTSQSTFAIHPLLRYFSLPVWVLDRDFLFAGHLRAAFIKAAINKFKPDLIHVMETQNGGYPFAIAADAIEKAGGKVPKAMLTLFGSDLFWFSRYPQHLSRIKRVLANVQLLSAECARDLSHAQILGFIGGTLPLMPVSGGLADEMIAESDEKTGFDSRKTIAVKGYGGTWGQGHLAIQELSQYAKLLSGYKVEIYSAEKPAIQAAETYLEPVGVQYVIHKKFALSHSEILSLYRRSRFYIGLSKSDGLPASMLEAMSQGCYPIQTASACYQGWVEPGVSASIIDQIDSPDLGKAIEFALTGNDELLTAQRLNLETIRSKYSKSALLATKSVRYSELANS